MEKSVGKGGGWVEIKKINKRYRHQQKKKNLIYSYNVNLVYLLCEVNWKCIAPR